MSDWRKSKRGVEAKEVCFCRLCNAEIVQLRFASGDPYWTDVQWDRGQRIVILGAGNNFNFKPQHDCLKLAENDLRLAEASHKEFYEKHAATVITLQQLDLADTEIAAKKDIVIDPKTAQIIKQIRESSEATFKTLDAQKPGIDQYLIGLREKVDRLRKGESVIPAGQPAVGRKAKVVKGRKVPVGTEGVIFWMGIDQFQADAKRIGIEANGQKYYTSTENIEVAV